MIHKYACRHKKISYKLKTMLCRCKHNVTYNLECFTIVYLFTSTLKSKIYFIILNLYFINFIKTNNNEYYMFNNKLKQIL